MFQSNVSFLDCKFDYLIGKMENDTSEMFVDAVIHPRLLLLHFSSRSFLLTESERLGTEPASAGEVW